MGKLTKGGFARAKSELGLKGKLTRKQVQRVFKRAIKKLGRKSPSKSRSTKTKTKTKKRRKTKMGRRKGRRRYSMTIPLAPIVGLIAAPAVRESVTALMAGDIPRAMTSAGYLLGIDGSGKFNFDLLMSNMGPIAAGLLVHKFVGGAPLNMNRVLGRARVPFIRI